MSASAPTGTEPQTCASCDRTSVLRHVNWRGRCPECRRFYPDLGVGRVAYSILLMTVIASAIKPAPKIVAVLAIWPVTLLGAVVHEMTHAGIAWLLGWRVHVIAIGSGGEWRRHRVGRAVLVLNGVPIGGGHCVASPPLRGSSARSIAIFTAAPLVVHVLVAALALRWASGASLGGVIAALLVADNLFDAAWNAWPLHASSDGRRLVDLVRSPEPELSRWRLHAVLGSMPDDAERALHAAELAVAREPGNPCAAMALAILANSSGRAELALAHVDALAKAIDVARPRELRRLGDRDLAARGLFRGPELEEYTRGSLLVALDRLDEVLALSERGVAEARSEEARALWQGCVALSLLLAGKDLDRADEAARWAYERLPWVAFVETAWGMARIERGDLDEGRAAFERARKADATGGMGALHTAWTAVAHVRRGEREQARMLAESLRAPGVWPACLRRAERALSEG